jgi:type IV pilus assembly protein PilO
MATARPDTPTNLASLQRRLQSQFRNLDRKDPSRWPLLPRALLWLVIATGVVAAAWFLFLTQFKDKLETEQAKEIALRSDYQAKLTKAVNLAALKRQREQVQQYVLQMEKQLPSKAEMAALLSDINQAGVGRSLQFDVFRPGQVVVREYYAELPITLRVTGRYHDIGAFASDVAHLSRIVTLNNISITPGRDGNLGMEATARTFRYLDDTEIAAQRQSAGAKK